MCPARIKELAGANISHLIQNLSVYKALENVSSTSTPCCPDAQVELGILCPQELQVTELSRNENTFSSPGTSAIFVLGHRGGYRGSP